MNPKRCLSAAILIACLFAPALAIAQDKSKGPSQGEWIADVERPAQKPKKKPITSSRCQRPGAAGGTSAC